MTQNKRKFGEGARYQDNPKNRVVELADAENLKILLKRHRRIFIERFGYFELRKISPRLSKKRNGHVVLKTRAYVKIGFRPSINFKRFVNER